MKNFELLKDCKNPKPPPSRIHLTGSPCRRSELSCPPLTANWPANEARKTLFNTLCCCCCCCLLNHRRQLWANPRREQRRGSTVTARVHESQIRRSAHSKQRALTHDASQGGGLGSKQVRHCERTGCLCSPWRRLWSPGLRQLPTQAQPPLDRRRACLPRKRNEKSHVT